MEDLGAVGDRARVSGRARHALILARGAGRRMAADDPSAALTAAQRAAAVSGEKAFMPVAGRPFLEHVVERLRAAGIEEIAVVVGPGRTLGRGHDEVAAIVQAEPRGTADAVLAGRAWAGDRPFLVVNGDNLYPVAAIEAVAALDGAGLAGFERDALVATSNIPAARIGAFAVIDADETGALRRIVEKPSAADLAQLPAPILVSMNLWRLDARIFDACRDVPASLRGEFELPSAVMLARERGVVLSVVRAVGPVLDLSQRGDVAAVDARLRGTQA
jgi:glucose-1-phosphate thymidylyltransferase